jgi:hypothetical protein
MNGIDYKITTRWLWKKPDESDNERVYIPAGRPENSNILFMWPTSFVISIPIEL